MEELASELERSVIDEQKQKEYVKHACECIDPDCSLSSCQERKRKVQHLNHACECKDPDCSLSSCQEMKRKVQHLENCKERLNGACISCTLFLSLCWDHAQNCQKAKCSVPLCIKFKVNAWGRQINQLKQLTWMKNRYIAAMRNRGISDVVLQSSPKNSLSSIQQEVVQQAQDVRSRLVAMQNSVLQPNLINSNASSLSSLGCQTHAPQPGTSINPVDEDLIDGLIDEDLIDGLIDEDLIDDLIDEDLIDILPLLQQLRAASKIPLVRNFCDNMQLLIDANFGENYPTIEAKTGLMASDK